MTHPESAPRREPKWLACAKHYGLQLVLAAITLAALGSPPGADAARPLAQRITSWAAAVTVALFIGSFVAVVVTVLLGAMVPPFWKAIRHAPLRTILWTVAAVAFIVLWGWCGASLGSDAGGTCEPDGRGGVYCWE